MEKAFALWTSLERDADDALPPTGASRNACCAPITITTRPCLLKANDIEERACAALRTAERVGVEAAIEQARTILAESDQTSRPRRSRPYRELGAQLESIGARSTWPPTSQKSRTRRGAEFLDTPLNNKLWLVELDAILAGTFTASMPEHRPRRRPPAASGAQPTGKIPRRVLR